MVTLRWAPGVTALALLASTTVALGQPVDDMDDINTGGLEIEAVAGWDGTVDPLKPVPVAFLLSNFSSQSIEGNLILTDRSGRRHTLLGDVYLSSGATRRLNTTQAMEDWGTCYAELHKGHKILWRRELPLSTGQQFVFNVNYVLVVNDSGRSLQFPEIVPYAAASSSEGWIAGEAGRTVRFLNTKSWQIPTHPGAMAVAQAIVFPEHTAVDSINAKQWQATAEWLCMGGTIFIHSYSSDIFDTLIHESPLLNAPPDPLGEDFNRRHRVGLGNIIEYNSELFASSSQPTLRTISETIAKLSPEHVTRLVRSGRRYSQHDDTEKFSSADKHLTLIAAFFGLYTVFSGLVALAMFRRNRRQIAVYTFVVVLTASVLAAGLGAALRLSRGDLDWVTVTQVGAGGAVQVGEIDVRSAGGRNAKVSVNGNRADLQNTGVTPRFYRWYRARQAAGGYRPFTSQANLAEDKENAYEISTPITPWGSRRIHATAYAPQFQRMTFELKRPHEPETDGRPNGRYTLYVVNNLKQAVRNCELIVGVALRSNTRSMSQSNADSDDQQLVSPGNSTTGNGSITTYHIEFIKDLLPGQAKTVQFDSDFKQQGTDQELRTGWPPEAVSPPRLSRAGTTSAWIIGTLDTSAAITVNQQSSDFEPRQQLHLFLQEIHPDDLTAQQVVLPRDSKASKDDEVSELP